MKSILSGLVEATLRVWELVAGDLALVADVEQDHQQHHPPLHWMSFPSMASVLASVAMTIKVMCSAVTSPLSFSLTYPMSTLCLHKDGTKLSQHPHVQVEPVSFPHTWSASRMPVSGDGPLVYLIVQAKTWESLWMHAVLSHSVVSDCLRPHGL